MKSGIRLLLLALLLTMLSSAAGAAAQDTVLPDLGGRAVTIAVENAYPPFNMLDANGVGVGWDYDSIREICVRLNCTPEFIPASWEGLIVAVSNGEFDVAADGITITAERAELVDFSMGYANIIQRLMVTVDEARFDNADAFIAGDYVLGVQLATTNYLTAVELVGESRIVGFSDFGSAVQALIGGDVDAVIIDDVAGQGYVGENAEQIKLLDDVLRADEQLGYIFPKGSDLVAPFNIALMSMIVDGTLNQINAVWGLGPYGDPNPDLGGRAVTIAVENAYPPFNMLDANGVGVGWDYDSIREICVRLNCTPEFIPASWEGLIVAVSNGEFDVAADGITITAERAELVDFSMGYANIIQRLMVTVDEARFDNADAFIAGDYVLGVQLATTNYLTAVELVGESRIVGFSDFGSAVQALIGGDVDAVIIDDVAGQGYVGENAEQIKLLDDVLRADEQLGYIFPKGSDLVAPFNMALMGMIVDGTLNQINAVWGLGPYFASE